MGNGDLPNARVLQAQGMVAAQAECSMTLALILMQNTADMTDTTLEEVAADVLERRVTFYPPA